MFVVPMFIPEGENVIVPNLFYDLIIDGASVFLLKGLSSGFPSLDQNGSKVVDPFSSVFGSSGF